MNILYANVIELGFLLSAGKKPPTHASNGNSPIQEATRVRERRQLTCYNLKAIVSASVSTGSC